MDIICNKCNKSYDIKYFRKRKNGYTVKDCKSCEKDYSKNYRKNNKDSVNESNRKYRSKNIEVIRKKEKQYRLANIEKIRQQSKDRYHNTYKHDIKMKLIHNARNRINKFITGKNKSSLYIIGCSVETLVEWIEYQFCSEMNWDNYGLYWNIDHLEPCSKFNFDNSNEIEKCFNWKNLRPMKVSDNCSKNNKIPSIKEKFIQELTIYSYQKQLKF